MTRERQTSRRAGLLEGKEWALSKPNVSQGIASGRHQRAYLNKRARLRRGSETRLDSPYPFVRRGVTRQDTLHANCLTARSLLTSLTTGADAGPRLASLLLAQQIGRASCRERV